MTGNDIKQKHVKRCKATKVNGRKCTTQVQKGYEYCYFHNPINQDALFKARGAGGVKKRFTRNITFRLPKITGLKDIPKATNAVLEAYNRGILKDKEVKTYATLIESLFSSMKFLKDAGLLEDQEPGESDINFDSLTEDQICEYVDSINALSRLMEETGSAGLNGASLKQLTTGNGGEDTDND